MSDLFSSANPADKTGPSRVIPSLFRSASLIAGVTFASKLLGLARDQMITHAYGASLVSDAYLYAFQIPSFALVLLGGLGGPFHTATVSVLSKMLKDDEHPTERAQKLVNTFITLTSVVFVLLSTLAFFFAPQIIDVIAAQASPQLKNLAVMQLRWMSPLICIGSVIGIFYGISNVYHRFFWPSLSPSAINVTLILWILILGPDPFGYALAISTLVGGILQLALQLPDYFKTGFRLFPAFHVKDPQLKTMGELLLPAGIGTTIGQLNIYVDMFFVSTLAAGSWTAILLGNRLIQLPLGILIIAMLVPLFPRFSRWVADNDFDALKSNFRDGVLTLWMVSFPIILLIFLVGQSAIMLLFQRGAFTEADTLMVTRVLMVLSLSIVPYMLRDSITRVFYAFNDSRTPLIVGLFAIGVNAFFDALWVKPYGISGIAFSTVVVTVFNATLLTLLIRKHIASLELSRLIGPTAKMLLATLLAGGLGYGLQQVLPIVYASAGVTNAYLQAAINIPILTASVGTTYFGLLIALRVPLVHKVLARFKRSKT